MSRQLLARAWAAGAGPGDSPLTIDLDSTICETYGLAKEGARHHGYTGARGYHPLLAIAAGTGEVLMSRLREGRANTARGAAHFLRETVGRVRYGGATAQLTVRADSGFYGHTVVSACRDGCPLLHRPPARQPAGPDRGDTGGGLDSHSLAADVAETTYPESTEGRPWGQRGCSSEWFWNRNPPGNKEHPIDAATEPIAPPNNPDRIRSLTTTAWWPMPDCSFLPPSPSTWACGNSSTITLTSAARRDRTRGTRC